jgi:hypothetical protein
MNVRQGSHASSLRTRAPILQLAAPAVLLVAGIFSVLGYLWLKHVPVTYEADSTVILLVHQETSENPYTYFPKSVIMTAQVVAAQAGQESVRQAVRAAGGLDNYQVTVQNDGNQWVPIYTHPTISFTVQSTDFKAVIATESMVIERMETDLATIQIQAGVPANVRIHMQSLGRGDATPLHGRPSRAIAAIGILSLWSAILSVRFARRRLASRANRVNANRVNTTADRPEEVLRTPSASAPADREKELVSAQRTFEQGGR